MSFAFRDSLYTGDLVTKPHTAQRIGRKRRAAGWTLLVLGVVVAAVWAASGWWECSWTSSYRSLRLSAGCFTSIDLTPGHRAESKITGLHFGDAERGTLLQSNESRKWYLWLTSKDIYPLGRRGGRGGKHAASWGIVWYADIRLEESPLSRTVCFVLWPVPLLLWTPAALLLRSGILARRRASTGACPKCGYSLVGISADGPCPECGKAGGATKLM